ncbi:Eukaryotic/viral aspartic protease [Phytophthora cinnamomi]|uniref:Eukaryotic/viral aspartic protease n=1 Tax=Phytophthora cinnamomi TaxID=4785 RepID=UPI00355A4BCE|nr:Eukaryotic/viral aspartic protease [Phytophthora cinnamomi]
MEAGAQSVGRSPKRKKLRAPDSADESLSKPQGKGTGRQYTAAEMSHMLSHTGLFRLLERDPNLSFIKPKLMSEFTGLFLAPDIDSPTSVMRAALTLFEMLRESGFMLGAFEMEKVYDWNLEEWTRTIRDVLEPLTVQAGSVEREGAPSVTYPASATTPSPPPRYQSSVDSHSSLKPPKRMPTNRPPRVMQLAAALAHAEPSTPSEEAIPKTLEDAIIQLMRSTGMRLPSPQAPVAPSEPPPPTRSEPATLGSHRYQEWQNLAYGATSDANEIWVPVEFDWPIVERPTYPTPKQILRPKSKTEGGQPDARQRPVSMPTAVAVTRKELVVTGEAATNEVGKEAASAPEQTSESDTDEGEEDDAVLIH